MDAIPSPVPNPPRCPLPVSGDDSTKHSPEETMPPRPASTADAAIASRDDPDDDALSRRSSSTASHPSPVDGTPRTSADGFSSRQLKRLSLNFPIQPAAAGGTRSRPQSWYGTPVPSPEVPQTPTSGNFLTALAAQERRVLELKEELSKAEGDLVSLKKQWASHEAARKRNDIRSVHPLQPLNTSLANMVGLDDNDDTDGSSLWMQKEMERRRALLSGTKTSQRKVFSGSRHTRQLSLLSPDKNFVPSFPQPTSLARASTDLQLKPTLNRHLSTPSYSPNLSTENGISERDELGGMPKDAILRAGKQIATDFKDGLLTFIEDLRQATVGEEATDPDHPDQSKQPRKQGSKSTLRGKSSRAQRPQSMSVMWDTKRTQDTDTLIDIGGSFWKDHGVDDAQPLQGSKSSKPAAKTSNKPRQGKTPQKQIRTAVDDFGESWDTWDTPTNDKVDTRSSGSTTNSDGRTSPISSRSSARTSTSSTNTGAVTTSDGNISYDTPTHNPKRNSIPWPALDQLSPTNLKRTASHLMKEWERSLHASPSAEALEAESYVAAKDDKHD